MRDYQLTKGLQFSSIHQYHILLLIKQAVGF